MGLYKTKGIILKSIKLGEADKIINIFSCDRGKISAVAKGIRKTKSKFGSRLEPFTYAHLLLYEGRNLDVINQAEIIFSFKEIREDLDRLAFGSAMLDIVNKISMEREKDERLFKLLLSSLEALSKSSGNYRLLLLAFDIKLMSIAGYLPELKSCVVCNRSVQDKARFSVKLGGIVCPSCFSADATAEQLSPRDVQILDGLLRKSFKDLLKLPPATLQGLSARGKALMDLVQDYLGYHLESRLKSCDYLSRNY